MTSAGARLVTLAVLMMLAAARHAAAQETNDYAISSYELTIDLLGRSAAARVTMDLTYQIASGTKSEGFKYIGAVDPARLAGTDGAGRPMRMSVERQRETLIRWRFTPAGRGETRVRVSFTIPAALTGSLGENVVRADWAGVFKVPVHRALYRLVFPLGWEEDSVSTEPPGYVRTTVDGRPAIEIEQRPLRTTAFVVTVSPGIVEAAPVPVRNNRGSRGFDFGFLIFMFVAIAVVSFVVIKSAKRGQRRTGDSSSCAGGSSCSSSCGGGGCGGGCGG